MPDTICSGKRFAGRFVLYQWQATHQADAARRTDVRMSLQSLQMSVEPGNLLRQASERLFFVEHVERRKRERRMQTMPVPFPDRRLTRSAYEQVFLKLVSGGRLRVGSETYTPVGMRGWDQAVFRRDSDGKERLLSIDQLLKKINDWK